MTLGGCFKERIAHSSHLCLDWGVSHTSHGAKLDGPISSLLCTKLQSVLSVMPLRVVWWRSPAWPAVEQSWRQEVKSPSAPPGGDVALGAGCIDEQLSHSCLLGWLRDTVGGLWPHSLNIRKCFTVFEKHGICFIFWRRRRRRQHQEEEGRGLACGERGSRVKFMKTHLVCLELHLTNTKILSTDWFKRCVLSCRNRCTQEPWVTCNPNLNYSSGPMEQRITFSTGCTSLENYMQLNI